MLSRKAEVRSRLQQSELLIFSMICERSEVSCFTLYKQPHVIFLPLSHTHTGAHTPPRLFQEDTITGLASASVPFLKLINAACDMGGHQEVFQPLLSSSSFPSSLLPPPHPPPKKLLNWGFILAARTHLKVVVGRDFVTLFRHRRGHLTRSVARFLLTGMTCGDWLLILHDA